MLGLFPEGELGEDCLTLNIFAPARASAPRPVLVWIQGGAFIGGASAVPLYDARRLAARGDVVVVTFDYRVGMLGFSTFDESSETTAVNAGLLDQIAALRFVREHIECFGGDPDRVTVFGELYNKGTALLKLGLDEEERICLSIALGKNPEFKNGWNEKAATLLKNEKYEEALKYFNKALKLKPGNIEVLLKKGLTLEKIGYFDEALNCFEEILKINPNHEETLENKAILLKRLY